MIRRLLATALILIALFGYQSVVAQDETTAIIASPIDGQQLFGQVNIIGSASHSTAFDGYTLEYNSLNDPNAPWLVAQAKVQQQVTNDVLGAWNTIFVPDGAYRLRLRVLLTDGSVGGEYVVANLMVVNSQPTPVPTVPIGGLGASGDNPTPGPSPTSPVEQPPSNNPNAESITGLDNLTNAETNGSVSQSSSTTRVNTSRIRSAFCSGVYLALIIFAGVLIYALARGRMRPISRRWRDY